MKLRMKKPDELKSVRAKAVHAALIRALKKYASRGKGQRRTGLLEPPEIGDFSTIKENVTHAKSVFDFIRKIFGLGKKRTYKRSCRCK
jgi:hypothetical protein